MKLKKKLILASIISLIIFIVILIEVLYNGSLVDLDLSINSLNITKNIFLIELSKIIGFIFDTVSVIIISLILSIFLWYKNSKKEGIFLSFTILLNSVIVFVIKETVQRARPLNSLVSENSFAFPSGHTATAVVFFGVLVYLILRKSNSKIFKSASIGVSIFMIILICFTRLYLNLHWFSDILGGLFIGVFILSICILLKDKIF
mgnify:CR=1 FL=1